jgi:hypothetical protein
LARLIHDKSLGYAGDAVSVVRDVPASIQAVGIGDAKVSQILSRFDLRVVIVDAHEHDALISVGLPGFFQLSGFYATLDTPGGPKVDHDYLALEVGQNYFSLVKAVLIPFEQA